MFRQVLRKNRNYGKFAFAAILAISFCMAHPASTAYAKKRRPAKYGTIKILSTPGGLPSSRPALAGLTLVIGTTWAI